MSEPLQTIDTFQAAKILKVSPKTVRSMAKQGRLPGRKVGSEWRFIEAVLEQWLRGDYSDPEQKPAGILKQKENKPCRSLNVVTPTGSILGTKDAEYEKALGL